MPQIDAKKLHKQIQKKLEYNRMNDQERLAVDIENMRRRFNQRIRALNDVPETRDYVKRYFSDVVNPISGTIPKRNVNITKNMKLRFEKAEKSLKTTRRGLKTIEKKRKTTFEDKLGHKLTNNEYEKLVKTLGAIKGTELYDPKVYEDIVNVEKSSNDYTSDDLEKALEFVSKTPRVQIPKYNSIPKMGDVRVKQSVIEVYDSDNNKWLTRDEFELARLNKRLKGGKR